jgi:uncharacterized phage-associated protein
VSNFILDEVEQFGRTVTNLALNKLLYFCHGWHLALHGAPLQREVFEAWPRGPVLRSVYAEFRGFRISPITTRATQIDLATGLRKPIVPQIDEQTAEFLRQFLPSYARLSAWQLVELSHVDGGPWDRAIKRVGGVQRGVRIPDETIGEFFRTYRGPRTQ